MMASLSTLNWIPKPRLTSYIPHIPTAKQYRFLCNMGLDLFFGGPLTLDSLVLTPDGFKTMGDISLNDKVLTPDGCICDVIDIPFEGEEDAYKITFSDNTFVNASAGHKWFVSTGDWRKTQNGWREKRTIELLENYKLPDGKNRYKIPLLNNLNFECKEHSISPYILGVLIGDGTITKRNPIKITNMQKHIYDRVSNDLISGYHLTYPFGKLKNNYIISRPGYGYNNSSNKYADELERLCLLGCKADTKFIPEEYLIDSKENRLSLLQGLMDTDGTVRDKKRHTEFIYSTISEKLKDDIIFLVQSLGGVATYFCENDYCYRININIKESICSLPEKVEKIKIGKHPVRMITNISYIGKLPVKCITVDHPDNLFITNSFIVTKNSAGGAKSDSLLMGALQFVDIPGYNAILIRNKYTNLSKPDGLMDRADNWLMGSDVKWEGEDKRWRFPSGATLSFGYLDGPRDHFNYQGPSYQYVGIDELVQIRENQALYMFSRLRKLEPDAYIQELKNLPKFKNISKKQLNTYYEEYMNLPLRFRGASNPPAREQLDRGRWVKQRYVDDDTRVDGAVFIPSKLEDNPHLNKDEYIKSLAQLDPITRAQLLKGDWNIQAKGGMFERHWFEIVQAAPVDCVEVRSWDLAATEPKPGKEPAYTAGVKMLKDKAGIYYIQSVVRMRKEPRHVEQLVRQVADTDGLETPIIMEQEPGSSGKNTIDYYRRKILPEFVFSSDKVSGSKSDRAAPLSSQAEAGNVKLVSGAWINDFLEEAETFPFGTFKDQIDAAASAFSYLAGIGHRPFRMRHV